MALSLTDRISWSVRKWAARGALKTLRLTLVPEWARTQFATHTFQSLTKEGARGNGIVFACLSRHVFSYPEPPISVYRTTEGGLEALPTHALSRLLARPNPQMGQAELLQYVQLYKAIGGNCYLYKVRSKARRPVELWPLNDSQVRPEGGGDTLVGGYVWTGDEDGQEQPIPAEDIVHLKWMPDPLAPWRGLAPLVAVAREVDVDNEARRYLFALLRNDAIPRLAFVLPPNANLTDEQFERLKAEWKVGHGGENRGGVGFLEGGADIKRIGLDLQELAFEALSRIPETRITAAFQVPAVLAGMNAGLERAIYENVKGFRRQFVEDTLAPMWRLDADELASDLLPEFGDSSGLTVAFDTSKVIALQEANAEKRTWVDSAVKSGYMTVAQAQAQLGLPVDPNGNYYLRSMTTVAVPVGDVAEGTPALPPGWSPAKMLGAPPQRKALIAPDPDAPALPDPDDDTAWEDAERESDERIGSSDAAPAPAKQKAGRAYDYAAKLDTLRSVYRAELADLAGQLRAGTLTESQWAYSSQVKIMQRTLDGYRLGIAQAKNISPSAVRLTNAERVQANALIKEQFGYFADFRRQTAAKMAAGEELTTAVDARAQMYAGSLRGANEAAKLSQMGGQRLRWARHAEDSCRTCIAHADSVHAAIEWQALGVWPSHGTDCDGNCQCELVGVVEEPDQASLALTEALGSFQEVVAEIKAGSAESSLALGAVISTVTQIGHKVAMLAEAPAPVVNVAPPPAPIVNVTLPPPGRMHTVKTVLRDAAGRAVGSDEMSEPLAEEGQGDG